MSRLCSESSRSYPGRPGRHGVVLYGSALCANMQGDRAASVALWAMAAQGSQQLVRPKLRRAKAEGHSRRRKPPLMVAWWLETILVNIKPGGPTPPKGQTRSMGNSPYVLRNAMTPNG